MHLRLAYVVVFLLSVLNPVFLTATGAEAGGDGLLLMTFYKWSGLSDEQLALYIKSFLETTSFAMYRRAFPDAAAEQRFSAWTVCAETKPIQSWLPLGWMVKGELKRTAASQFTEMASLVCGEFLGKELKRRPPVQLVSPRAWQALGLRDRAIYIMGYIETVYEAGRVMNRDKDLRYLDICLGNQGVEGVLEALQTIEIDYPLPWSISQALGKACRPYRQ